MSTIRNLINASQVIADLSSEADNRLITITDQAIGVAENLALSQEVQEFTLPPRVGIGIALQSAVQSVSALLSVASVSCNRAAPPADIEMKVNASGRLIYRCYHSPAHEWDLTGLPLP